jgi:hypothetical protein
MDFLDPDGRLDAGAGFGCGPLRGAETGRTRTGRDHGVGPIMALAAIIGDLPAPGVLDIVHGYGRTVGAPDAVQAACKNCILRFNPDRPADHAIGPGNSASGDARTGRQIAEHVRLGLMAADDACLDKSIEGFGLCAFNRGAACTAPIPPSPRLAIVDNPASGATHAT